MTGGGVIQPSGRLELTWTNKHLRLLAHEDGSYEWVEPGDHRVAEVRPLDDVMVVGDAGMGSRARDNLLIQGDALAALTSLVELPEFRKVYAGKVRLVYIDPPFNTGQAFESYDDALEHSVWLTMFRDRLVQIKELLALDGSVWVHLDDTEVHRARCVMDEVFGAANFVASIAWQKRTTRENRAAFSSSFDMLLVYAPAGPTGWRDRRNLVPRSKSPWKNPDDDPRGAWTSVPFSAQGYRPNQMYEITSPTGKAHKTNRRWVGIERRADNVATYALPRLRKVVDGDDPGGITESVEWKGGGGFRVLEVGPSMFAVDGDRVVLAEGLTTEELGERVAAQLGYVHDPVPPFSGRKGRSRLAVIVGFVNEAVARALVEQLPATEKLAIYASSFDPAVRDSLRAMSPGSTIRKLPRALLDGYRSGRRGALSRVLATAPDETASDGRTS